MEFNSLKMQYKQKLHKEVLSNAMSIGGKNFFLQMIEDIKNEKPNPLLNKTGVFYYSQGKVSMNKPIYKDTLTTLFDAMKKEDLDGDILNGLNPKEYKLTMNMMRTLKPLELIVSPKNLDDGDGFKFSVLDTSVPKSTKVSMIFKIIFFYNIDFAKKVLNYE